MLVARVALKSDWQAWNLNLTTGERAMRSGTRFASILVGGFLAFYAVPALAQNRQIDPERFLQFADTNGDGQVDAQEREAAMARLRQRQQGAGEQAGNRNRNNPAANPTGRPNRRPAAAGDRPATNPQGTPDSSSNPRRRPGAGNQGMVQEYLLNQPQVIARFDRNGDGELNEQEREAARRAVAQFQGSERGAMMSRFDEDGDGELSDSERQQMRASMMERGQEIVLENAATGQAGTSEILDKSQLLERFDADGDGKLNSTERAAARQASLANRRGR